LRFRQPYAARSGDAWGEEQRGENGNGAVHAALSLRARRPGVNTETDRRVDNGEGWA